MHQSLSDTGEERGCFLLQLFICFQLFRQSFFDKLFVNGFANEGVDYSEDRNTEEHTDDTEDSAHRGNGDHDPDTAHTNAVAEDLGRDDVAVDLLNDENEDRKDQRGAEAAVWRDENDDGARNCAEEGTEYGDQVGDTDHQRDHGVVGNVEDPRQDIDDEHNDAGVENFAADELTEFFINGRHKMAERDIATEGEKREEKAFDLRDEKFLRGKKIYREEQTKQGVFQKSDNACHDVERAEQERSKVVFRFVENALNVEVGHDRFVEIGKGFVFVNHILQVEGKLIEERDRLIHEVLYALNELRKQNIEEDREGREKDQICRNDTERAERFFAELTLRPSGKERFKKLKDRIEKIGENHADCDWRENVGNQPAEEITDRFQIDDESSAQYGKENDEAGVDRIRRIFFIEMPFDSAFLPSHMSFLSILYEKKRKINIFFKTLEKKFKNVILFLTINAVYSAAREFLGRQSDFLMIFYRKGVLYAYFAEGT